MVDERCEGDVDHAKYLFRSAYRGSAFKSWVDGCYLGCPKRLLSSFGCKVRDLGRPDAFTERRRRAQGVQRFQPKGSSRCASLSHVCGLSVWTWGRRPCSQEIPLT